ncbi:MAG: nickel pincer cofactor biosynthesis protein LarB [Pseudanabaenaceae cyanobacterium SKYGB_i_bin29]|nr:nickel pincer cofactor biosynthesis protein LarB [Pseudanabaenaceae cyanobacterium SKYG29]MDW8422355.1 nickel pincer cofactor biosynthesis protein LarB [Pseudanabaenaceae cyanobacterium SKYGB_i_bin29]
MEEKLKQLFNQVAQGSLSPEKALAECLGYQTVGDFARVDSDRLRRQSFPEVVLGLGKTPAQISAIMQTLRQHHPIVMATRITPEVYQAVQRDISNLYYYPLARIAVLGEVVKRSGRVTILTGGTGDIPVAEEAAVTVECWGFSVERVWDVGVAGLHRLLAQQDILQKAQVVIVVAGMEGALASVVGGLVACPVIGVPTSIGYGAHLGGIAPLLTMLNSCSAGVAVVNIDNGFGAGMLAARILLTTC